MPLAFRVFSRSFASITRRFSTKSSRFAFAVSLGFAFVGLGVGLVGFDRSGSAEGLADLFGSGFAGSLFGQPQQAQPQYGVDNGSVAFRHQRHAGRRRSGEVAHNGKHDGKMRLAKIDEDGAPENGLPIGRHSICVRLCDGYTFPVGDYHGDGDRRSHEATCHSECPGAETALYVMPAGSDSIADAVRVGTNRSYAKLPDAFHYANVIDNACSCHPAGGNRITSLLHDFTLRRGDAVMTASGFKVFHGARSYPYKRNDFVALSRSRDIRGPNRATFKAIERASLPMAREIAAAKIAPPAKAAPIADRNGTKALEHQASR